MQCPFGATSIAALPSEDVYLHSPYVINNRPHEGNTILSTPRSSMHQLPNLRCFSGEAGASSSSHQSPPRTCRALQRVAAGATGISSHTFSSSLSLSSSVMTPCKQTWPWAPSGSGAHFGQRRKTVISSRAGDGDPELEVGSTKKDASREKGILANEELLLFFFQLDLTTRLQKALNLDQYEPAKQLREKIAEVEQELARQREARMGASSKDEAQDMGLSILRIKADLQKAIEEERYSEAAALRDSLSKLEADALAASLSGLATSNVAYEYRLGQKIRHKAFGYRGVICGMDPVCCESEEWSQTAQVDALSRGRNQPFYQVLVDVRELTGFLVAYVPEESLMVAPEPDMDPFNHPYTYLLFYGTDGNGDFVPTKQLREKYNAPRHELPYDDKLDDGQDGGDDPLQ